MMPSQSSRRARASSLSPSPGPVSARRNPFGARAPMKRSSRLRRTRPRLVEQDGVAIDEQVERHQRGRGAGHLPGDIRRALQMHAALQRLEARGLVAIERDDLAVEHERPLATLRERANARR